MKIGFVSTWLERGATYVTKTYMSLLEDKHELFVYARGGEKFEKGNPRFDAENVTWGLRLGSTKIDWSHFSKWIEDKKLDVILFNEQKDIINVLKIKKYYPSIKLGAYVDYYTEDTVADFEIYDFLLCNTKRHYSVFKWHQGAHYIPWGTDINVFNYTKKESANKEITFFHSVGMSSRKGTDALVSAFINGKIYEKSAKLIIHSQIDINHIISEENAKKHNIEIIVKEVPAPGLYHLGDVYVYPTTLDGLGLTIYEALACGLPVITTNYAPMNEVINESNGKLVKVDLLRARKDGYYWPLAFVNENSLIEAMECYCRNRDKLNQMRESARAYAEKYLNIMDRKEEVCKVFESTPLKKINNEKLDTWIKEVNNKQKDFTRRNILEALLPNRIKHYIRVKLEENRIDRSKLPKKC